ncbi:hypothetical protein QR680_003316 [Steinernema hermaphroditum]|uniref:Uncharacterized protein n=1 Tax=Steinernema hermaphroditum TaxID=289476 RepID=A0AA39LK33_9BILA|nr:hypothetical protein QR680_003316 [Steinernema hermaphroditum]
MVDSDLDMYLDSTAERVASVTLESDSFPETPDIQRTKYKRRRKIIKKARNPNQSSGNACYRYQHDSGGMDVDVDSHYSEEHHMASGSNMEWERDLTAESDLSSDSECTDDYSDADDEQSDDEPLTMSKRPETTFERRGTSMHGTASFGCATPRTIMRRLERFVRDDSQSEIEIPCLSKPHEA